MKSVKYICATYCVGLGSIILLTPSMVLGAGLFDWLSTGPIIYSVSPLSIRQGQSVTVLGSFDASVGRVVAGDTAADVSSWQSYKIEATVSPEAEVGKTTLLVYDTQG